MPEGHTIHRLAARHNTLLGGHRNAVSSPQGRFAAGASLVDGRVLDRVDPYGKHLFYRFSGDATLHVHLGLYGVFADGPVPPPEPRGALRARLCSAGHWVDLRGPTACDVVDPAEVDRILARLGPDPLRPRADRAAFAATLARRVTPVGALLLDQAAVAGVGNVYRAEALFRLGVSPFRPANEVDAGALWPELVTLMRAGVRAGRIVTTRAQDRGRPRGEVSREDAHYVYRRSGLPCRRCGTEVASAPLAARTVYWCPRCQPG